LLGDSHVTDSLETALTEILGKHVFGGLALTVAGVTDNWDPHVAVGTVFSENPLKAIRKSGKVTVGGETLLEDRGLNGNLAGLILQVRSVEVTLELTRREGSF